MALDSGIGVRGGDAALRGRIESAIASMREDRSLNRLVRKRFGEETELF